MTNNWGGSRKNAGRKKLDENSKKKGYTFQLVKEDIEYIEQIEGENRSDSLRNLIKEHKNLKKQIDNSR